MPNETEFRDALAQHADLARGRQDVLAALRDPRRTPPPARNLVPLGVVAATVVLFGARAVGLITLTGTPAYEVTRNADGTVTVKINDVAAIDPANEKLRELGVRAAVVPATSDCAAPEPAYPGTGWDVPSPSGDSITIGRVPEGYTLLLSVHTTADRGTGLGFTAPVKGSAPACVPADDPERATPR